MKIMKYLKEEFYFKNPQFQKKLDNWRSNFQPSYVKMPYKTQMQNK